MGEKTEKYSVKEVGRKGLPPYVLVNAEGEVVEPVSEYLLDLLASDCSVATVKSYAYDLLDWFRFLALSDVSWGDADHVQVRDYVLRLRSARNPYRQRSRTDSPTAGSLNERTGKPYLSEGYESSTINHRLTVIRSFYEFHVRVGRGPSVNPVVDKGRNGRRNAHHRPGDPWKPGRRGRYRQKQPERVPRAIPDRLWEEVFDSLTSDRDRAIACLLVSSGARASEMLGMTGADVDWGGGRVRLIAKGSRDAEWVAASPDFFRWLGRYLTMRGTGGASGPLWLTLRKPFRPLNYQALRAVLVRVNKKLGTNLVLHDFRHTCAMRLANDPDVPITDVQTHLRHKHLSSTEVYLIARPEEVIRKVQAHHKGDREPRPDANASKWNYDAGDLDVLLGEGGR